MKCLALWLLGLSLCLPAGATDLGRLFTTPAQREKLQARLPDEDVASHGTPPRQQGIRVEGILMRQGGDATVWINGSPAITGDDTNGTRLLGADRRRAVVVHPAWDGPLALKPGQEAEWNGRVREPRIAMRIERGNTP